jgi:hypothetical protein
MMAQWSQSQSGVAAVAMDALFLVTDVVLYYGLVSVTGR